MTLSTYSSAQVVNLVDPYKWVLYPFDMEPVQFSDALRITELSESQLREWCGKRGLFHPTVPARGAGRVALYSWQDLVSLRVFREIISVFGGKASGWADGVSVLRGRLNGQFFPSLWGKAAIFTDQRSVTLSSSSSGAATFGAALIVPLDPHLRAILSHAVPEQIQGELPLVTQIGLLR